MRTVVKLAVLACWAGSSAVCAGQLIGKVPPPTPPTPEYTPPAPAAPPPPPKPAEPEKPLPSLAVKGEDGKVIKYPQGAERAAVAAYEFDAEARKKITASEGARDAQLERTVVDKLDQAVAAWKTREGLDQIRDFAEFARIKDVAQPLQTERLVDRLMRDGAITPLQRSRLDQMVKEYESALKAEWEAQTGTDVLKIVGLVGREKFEEGTRDALAALDRLLGRAAAGSGGENVRARFFDEMKPEERRALLEPLVAPAPAR